MHSAISVALLHTPHVEQLVTTFQATVLEPLVRRGVIQRAVRQELFPRDSLFWERTEGARLLILFLSKSVDQVQLRGVPLLESLRLRHGRSAVVLPVLAQATFESFAEGFLPLPIPEPPSDVQVLSQLIPAVERALEEARALKTNHAERPPVTSIVGRDHVLADMARFFEGGVARFICLTAPFGRGTSSIARAYAESVKSEFPGGFIDMSSMDDDESSRRLAQTLGVQTLPSNWQSPAVILNEVLAARADTLVLLEMSHRELARTSAPLWGARTIITTHVEMNVPTAYTYQVPKLDEAGQAALAARWGLEGPLVALAEGEPLAYVLIRSMRTFEGDDEKIAYALRRAKAALDKNDLHECWLTPIAAFFSVWWSLLPEETRQATTTLSLCPPSGVIPQNRVERFARSNQSFDAAIAPLMAADLLKPTIDGLWAVQPALLAWLERFRQDERLVAFQRAEKSQEFVFLDVERLEREHSQRGTDAVLEEMSTLRQAGFFGSNEALEKMRSAIERGRGFFRAPRTGDRPEAFLQYLLNHAVRFNNPDLRDAATKLLEGREATFLLDRFVTESPDLGRLLRGRDKRVSSYSMRQGHAAAVVALAYSMRGLLSASDDGLLLCWDVETGACLGAIEALPRGLTSMAVDREGNVAIVGAYDGSIVAWNLVTQSRRLQIKHPEAVSLVAVHPKGTTYASVGPSGVVFLWNATNGETCGKVWAHQGSVTGLAWLDDSRLATLGADGILRVWNVESLQCLHARYLRGAGIALAGTSGGIFVTLDASGCVLRFSAAKFDEMGAIEVGGNARTCAVTNDGALIVTGHDDGRVRVWQGQSGKLLAERIDRFPIRCVVAMGSASFAHSEMNLVRILDVRAPGDNPRVAAMAAPALQTANADREIALPEAPWPVVDDAISTQHEHCQWIWSRMVPREEVADDGPIVAMTNSADGDLVVLTRNGSIHRWNLAKWEVVRRYKAPFEEPFWPALSVDGSLALSMSPRKKNADVLDAEGPAAVRKVSSSLETMILWNTNSNEIVATLPRKVSASMLFAKTPNGRVAFAVDEGLEVWDLHTETLVRQGRGECVGFSKSGRLAAIRAEDGLVIEDVDSGKTICFVRGISGYRGRVLLREDGRALVTMEYSRELCFVDLGNGTVHRSPAYSWDAELRAFAFSADENLVYAATKDGKIDVRETFSGILRGGGAVPKQMYIRTLITSPQLIARDDLEGLQVFETRVQQVQTF